MRGGARKVEIAKENEITKTRQTVGDDVISQIDDIMYSVWRWVIKHVVAYGYRPFGAFGYLAVLWVVGVLVFGVAYELGYMFPARAVYYEGMPHNLGDPFKCDQENDCLEPKSYPMFSPFLFSLELATPLPDLGQQSHWEVGGSNRIVKGWFEVYKWIHTIIGWFLSFLLVLSPTRLLLKQW